MPKDNDGKMLTEAQRTLEELVWEEKGKLFSNRRGMVGLPLFHGHVSQEFLCLLLAARRRRLPWIIPPIIKMPGGESKFLTSES